MTQQAKQSGRGCLFYGGIVAAILIAVLMLAVYMGYRYAKNLVNEYTDATPMSLPTVTLSSNELQRLQERIQNFSSAIETNKTTEALTLTADEVNGLIMNQPELQFLKGHMYLTFAGEQVKAQASFPADGLGFRPLRGRYINGAGTFRISLRNGNIGLYAESLTVKGKPIPESFMRGLRSQNFLENLNHKPESRDTLEKLQDIQIKDGKITVLPKQTTELEAK